MKKKRIRQTIPKKLKDKLLNLDGHLKKMVFDWDKLDKDLTSAAARIEQFEIEVAEDRKAPDYDQMIEHWISRRHLVEQIRNSMVDFSFAREELREDIASACRD